MGQRVKDAGGSECHAVMAWIGIEYRNTGVYMEQRERYDIIPPERVADFRGTGKTAACSGRSRITRELVRMRIGFSK